MMFKLPFLLRGDSEVACEKKLKDCTRNDHLDVSVLGSMYLYKELKIHAHEQRRVDVDMCKKDLLDPFRIMSNMGDRNKQH